MPEFLLPLAGATLGLTLAVSGVLHARRPRQLTDALREQGVWPRALLAPVALAVIALELGLGAAMVLLTLTGGTPDAAVLAVVAALFAGFGAYVLVVARRRPGAPCGCGPYPVAADGLVAARAFALAAVAAALLAAHEAAGAVDLTAWQAVVVAEAAIAVSALVLLVPAAVRAP